MNEGLFCVTLIAGLLGYPSVRMFVLQVWHTIRSIAGALDDRF
jgi:hypothetical protein